MNLKLDAELKSAEETVRAVKRLLNKGKFPDDERTVVVVAFRRVRDGMDHRRREGSPIQRRCKCELSFSRNS